MLKSVEKCLKEISKKDEEIYSNSHYDEITSKVYDAYYRKLDWYNENKNKIDKNIEDSNNKILCLACGPGSSIKYINKKYNPSKIVGLDYSPHMINLAKERLSENNIELKQGDFTDLSNVNDSFDFIYMLGNPINHYKDSIMKKIIPEVSDVLKQDGLFLYDLISYEGWKNKNLHLNSVEYDTFEIIRAGCGFDEKKENYWKSDTYMTYLIKDLELNNSNKVHIEDLELYSHSEENHKNHLKDYSFLISREENRKTFLVSK